MSSEEKIKRLFAKSDITVNSKIDDRIINDALTALDESDQTQSVSSEDNIRRIIMKSPITKLAAAAVIIIPILIGINQFGGSLDGASVAWADVVKNIEQVQTFTCRIEIESEGMEKFGMPEKTNASLYISCKKARRIDTYVDQKLFSIEYLNYEKNEMITLFPEAKVYVHKTIDAGILDLDAGQKDPKDFLLELLSFEHTNLGRKRINGIMTEGIEVNDPKLYFNTFNTATARLWVDVATNLPVLFEEDGSADDRRMRLKRTFDTFEWNTQFDQSLLESNIPADYTLLAHTKIDMSEEMAIEGFHNFANFTGGQYPSSMVLLIAGKEIVDAWQASINWEQRPARKEEQQQIHSIQSTFFFHVALDKENKDVAYYGEKVTADDSDAVLMRWKVSDNKYRVVYGDLTSENISAAQLAALENAPAFIAIMQRPRKAMKVQGFIGIDLSSWPTIKVAPGMPAEKAGLQNGDVVIKVGGKDISQIKIPGDALKILVGPAGEMLSITVKRDEQVLDFNVERVPLPK